MAKTTKTTKVTKTAKTAAKTIKTVKSTKTTKTVKTVKADKTAIIIPARYNSKRLQGKPLMVVDKKPIIQWVWERAVKVKGVDSVIIATDDKRIFDTAKKFGADVEMTSEDHKCGSDRIVEVAERHPEFAFIINLQGDEPMIDTKAVEEVIRLIKTDKEADISTLLSEIKPEEDLIDPNMVKCVKDKNGFAMYFSRSKIPYERNLGIAKFYKHIGIYGYRRESLFEMTKMEQPEIEKAESLEQLRALYNGMKIKTSVVEYNSIGIDTIEDFNEFKRLVEKPKKAAAKKTTEKKTEKKKTPAKKAAAKKVTSSKQNVVTEKKKTVKTKAVSKKKTNK